MQENRPEAIAPDTPPNPWGNDFAASAAEEPQYVPPAASVPDEYWHEAARAQTAARSSDVSTVACWVCVLIGLVIPLIALGAALWALWMARDDSRFWPPAAVGFGIVALAFLG
jgi:hypothetical protein